MKLSKLLLEEEEKETAWILLDTFQDGEAQFTSVSKTKKDAEKMKQFVIDRFDITSEEDLANLKIFEVPYNTYFEKREEVDKLVNTEFT